MKTSRSQAALATFLFGLVGLVVLFRPAATSAGEPGCPATWQCLPGQTSPMRLLDGDVQCASLDGRTCLWGACPTGVARPKEATPWRPAPRPAHLIPLICGPDHAAKHGSSGYDTEGHWCREACQWLGCDQAGRPLASARPPAGQVVLFRDLDYGGPWQALSLGSHDMAELTGGIGNDALSSIRVPKGLAVTVFEHMGFTGRSRTFTADTPWVGDDFNDIASSVMVSASEPGQRRVVETVRQPDGPREIADCPRGARWGCERLTQGAPPPRGEEPPPACGCIPSCPPGRSLMTSYAGGTWEDGSRRGAFSCVTSLPP